MDEIKIEDETDVVEGGVKNTTDNENENEKDNDNKNDHENPLKQNLNQETSEEVKSEEVKIDSEEKVVDKGTSTADGKHIFIIAVIILGVFAFSLGGFKLYNFTSASILDADVLNVDQLHQMNEEGKLDAERGYMYNGYSFVKVDGMWWTKLMYRNILIKIPLHFGPKEVELVKIEGEIGPEFNQQEQIFIAIDPNVANKFYSLALSEISFNIVKGINRNIIGACTEENEACDNRTIINCENAQGRPVIELEIGGEPKIELDGSCIKVKGEEYGIVRAANRLLYVWYGIMK